MDTVTLRRQGYLVSSRRKKKEQGPMPAASAGLLRFFEEETEGVKIRPELLVVLSVALVVLSVLAKVFFP
jgi:preprotein translocase subunit Sec61beta